MDFDRIASFIQAHYQTKGFISLHEPVFHGKEREYVLDAIDSTFVSSVGAYVDRFENMVRDRTQVACAVAVVNGTTGLQLALELGGVMPGDEVISQSLTFVATSNAIAHLKAHPVFVDVDLDTMGMSPSALDEFLENYGTKTSSGIINKVTGRRIAAVLPMHTFGFPVDLDGLLEVCNRWEIPLIEDAAEALGSFYRGRPVGGFGTLGVLSFNGNKIITTGGGGMVLTNDPKLGARAKHLSTTAKVPHPYAFIHDEVGYNFRMPNLNAALGCAQLESLDSFLVAKRELAKSYGTFFGAMGITVRQERAHTRANYWLNTLQLKDSVERDKFIIEMNTRGVMCRPAWTLNHRLPMYTSCIRDKQTNACWLEERIVNIPSGLKKNL